MIKKKNHYLGWLPDKPDARDYVYAPRATILPLKLPFELDLRSSVLHKMPPVFNQGRLGSCTAQAIASAVQFVHGHPGTPSRLFIYYNERWIHGWVNEDSGAYIRDGFKTIANRGVCNEKLWPYNIKVFTKKPPSNCYKEALKHRALEYMRVPQNLVSLKTCLFEGYPIVFGFSVYESFYSTKVTKTGEADLPAPHESMLGGHAVKLVGYNDATQRFIIKNSWGAGWGNGGYFTLPYAYLTDSNLSDDFWTVRKVT